MGGGERPPGAIICFEALKYNIKPPGPAVLINSYASLVGLCPSRLGDIEYSWRGTMARGDQADGA